MSRTEIKHEFNSIYVGIATVMIGAAVILLASVYACLSGYMPLGLPVYGNVETPKDIRFLLTVALLLGVPSSLFVVSAKRKFD